MIGIGTVINTVAVVAGSGIGIYFKKGINDRLETMLMQTCGVTVMFIGVTGTVQGMMSVENGIMLLVFSLMVGGLFGELMEIEKSLEKMGERIKQRLNAHEDSRFVEGFVNTSLTICVGAMGIIGSIQDGLSGDYSILAAKSVVDFGIVIVFASTYGIGVLFTAIPIFLYQGGITLLTVLLGPLMGEVLISQLSYVGSALIFCVGINIIFGKKFNVGNMLPALLGPFVYLILQFIFKG